MKPAPPNPPLAPGQPHPAAPALAPSPAAPPLTVRPLSPATRRQAGDARNLQQSRPPALPRARARPLLLVGAKGSAMADNETKKEASAGAAQAGGGGGGGGKLLVILVAVNLLLSGGALAVSLLQRPAPAHPVPAAEGAAGEQGDKAAAGHGGAKGEKGKPELPGPTVKLPDFVVHLRDPEVDRYARLTVEIEVADDKAKEALTARLPHVRDSFIAYLSDRSTADLRGSDAIARAKSDLAERLRQAAPAAPVRGLFFTELVVQ